MTEARQTQIELYEEIRDLLKSDISGRRKPGAGITEEDRRTVRVKELAQAFSYASNGDEFQKEVLDRLEEITESLAAIQKNTAK